MTKMKVNGMDGCKRGCKLSSTEHELCISFACRFCEKKPPLLFCRLLHMQGRKPGARRQEERALDWALWAEAGAFRRGAEHPLASSVRHWFLLSFGTPFWALHKPCNLVFMFFLSYSIKRRTFCCFSFASVLGTCFALQAQCSTPHLPCRKCSTVHCDTIRHWRGVFFFICCRHKVKKGIFFENPVAEQRSSPQGCTVSPETRPDRAGR